MLSAFPQYLSSMTVAAKRVLRGVPLALAVLIISSLPANADSEEASHWLMKINEAASSTSFSGTFIYLHDDSVVAMHVTRRVDNGAMQERLYALSGEAREVIRDKDRVWCYIPDQNVGVHDYRQLSESGFPRMLPADLPALGRYYHFEVGDRARIADRMAQQIRIIPQDKFRYGYHLWADVESGLLLRSDLVDGENNLVEQYMFVDIRIGINIPDSALAPVTNSDLLDWYGMDRPNLTAEIEDGQWKIAELPAGYRLSRHFRRMSPMEMEEEEHFVLTDGLASVSVFVKKAREGQSTMTGLSRMGAVHAWRDTVEDHWITVMGEVPAATVEYLASQITYQR